MVTVSSPNLSTNADLSAGARGSMPGSMLGSDGDLASDGRSLNGPAMLHNVAQGAHQTIDRLTEQVTPQLQRLQDNMASATESLDERADQLRLMSDEWIATLRSTVRENPLGALAAALALGMLVARVAR